MNITVTYSPGDVVHNIHQCFYFFFSLSFPLVKTTSEGGNRSQLLKNFSQGCICFFILSQSSMMIALLVQLHNNHLKFGATLSNSY